MKQKELFFKKFFMTKSCVLKSDTIPACVCLWRPWRPWRLSPEEGAEKGGNQYTDTRLIRHSRDPPLVIDPSLLN